MSFCVTSFVGDGNKENVPNSENGEIKPISEDEESSRPYTGSENGSENTPEERLESPSIKPSKYKICWNWWCAFYSNYSFMILAVAALLLAYAYPPLGAVYVYPQITSSYIALITIFLLAGLGLKTKELKNALKSIGFNAFVQIFNFGVDSSIVFGFAVLLKKIGAISDPLAQGMIICGCLSVTVNMVFVLTKNAGGDEAIAIFHAAFVSGWLDIRILPYKMPFRTRTFDLTLIKTCLFVRLSRETLSEFF
jgi:sodium/bile acid cotransporter 7